MRRARGHEVIPEDVPWRLLTRHHHPRPLDRRLIARDARLTSSHRRPNLLWRLARRHGLVGAEHPLLASNILMEVGRLGGLGQGLGGHGALLESEAIKEHEVTRLFGVQLLLGPLEVAS